jgi:outer membrane murein-binding lipoprotein Lpp
VGPIVVTAVLAGVTVAGCSAGDGAHVIGSPSRASTSSPATTAPSQPTTTGSGPTPTTTATTVPAGAGLPNQASVDQVESELQQLSASLEQANNDLNSTQGDN